MIGFGVGDFIVLFLFLVNFWVEVVDFVIGNGFIFLVGLVVFVVVFIGVLIGVVFIVGVIDLICEWIC